MSQIKTKALIIDDEESIRAFLKTALTENNIELFEAKNSTEGIAQAIALRPDFILLDLGLPDKNGLETLTELRTWYPNPILILSVQNQEETIVTALDSGADDYMTKPFKINELLARIRTCQRLYLKNKGTLFQIQNISIDFESRIVKKKDLEIKLTATEFDLLKAFCNHADKIVTHRQLLKEIWGPNASEHIQYLRVYVGHLRQKIEDNSNQPKIIMTEPGIGYRLVSKGT
jgi:two-component system KDP operon response regulator KdpE